jgi:oligosaccharide translocation protein RFT1
MKSITTDNASRAAARGMLFTLGLRLVSFVCTQLTIRALDPSTLGKANIQLELLLTSVLFTSREGFRLALTQQVRPENWGVAWLTIPVVTLVSGSTMVWHILAANMTTNADTDYRLAGILYCMACWIEGCAEPAVLYFLRRLEVPQRVSAEGIATVSKTLTTVVALQLLPSEWHLTSFGMAQIVYALTYALYLYQKAWTLSDWKKGLPSSISTLWREMDWNTCYVALVFTLQGFFKHLLTEADKIVLTTVSDSYDQGVYAMGAAYGSMAARILLQPLEENARLLWSRLASVGDYTSLEQSYKILLRFVLYIGLVFSCVAVHYTNLLLNVLAGSTWGHNADAANVLSAFCIYTAFLALNGMTEAFVYAVSGTNQNSMDTTAEMIKLGVVHSLTGVVFALAACVFVAEYGTLGLIGANCVAMSMRSLYSLFFAVRFFCLSQSVDATSPETSIVSFPQLLYQIFPHPVILVCFAATWFATSTSLDSLAQKEYHLRLDIRDKDWLILTGKHIGVGVSCLIGIATLVAFLERGFLWSLKAMVRKDDSKGKASKQD